MPLYYNSLLNTGAHIWVWHLTETEIDLIKFIDADDFLFISNSFHHPQRRMQKIAARLLLNYLGNGQRIELEYNENGKPKMNAFQGSISISHSKNFVGLLYHPIHSCGLDLEEVDDRVVRIAPRFLNAQELKWVDATQFMMDAGLIWSVKESLFKNIGGGGILFKDHLTVYGPQYTSEKGGYGNAVYDGPKGLKNYKYEFENLEGVLMVHTIAIEIRDRHKTPNDLSKNS